MKSTASRTPAQVFADDAEPAAARPGRAPRKTASKPRAGRCSCDVVAQRLAELDRRCRRSPAASRPRAARSRRPSCSWRCRIRSARRPSACASKTTTSWPERASRCAHDSPAGPAPTTAMRLPVAGPRANSASPADRSPRRSRSAAARPISTGLRSLRVAHADVLAQDLGRADARAGAAERCSGSRMSRAAPRRLSSAMLRMKLGDVDAGRAGLHARRVVAVEAALRLDQRLRARQRRRDVVERRGVLRRVEAAGPARMSVTGASAMGWRSFGAGLHESDHLVRIDPSYATAMPWPNAGSPGRTRRGARRRANAG